MRQKLKSEAKGWGRVSPLIQISQTVLAQSYQTKTEKKPVRNLAVWAHSFG